VGCSEVYRKKEESGYGDDEVLAGGETVRMDRRRTEKAHKAWIRRKGLMIDWIGVVLGGLGLVWGWTWDRVVRYTNCQPNPANQ
jgi:hypothetical protein